MRVRESPLRDLLRLVAWYPFRWLVGLVPVRLALAAFRGVGDVHRALAGEQVRRLERNLGRMGLGPGPALRAAVRQNFRTHYVSQLLLFVYPRLTRRTVDELAGVDGLHHLEAALALGRGAVLVQAHMGPEQLALAALALRGYRAVQIGCLNEQGLSAVGRGVALRLRRRLEAAMPGEMLDARTGLLPAFRALRENALVLCAGDGAGWTERLGEHVPVTLFGRCVAFPTGAARIALGAGAPLLPVFVVTGSDRPFTVVIEAPIDAADETAGAGPGVESNVETGTSTDKGPGAGPNEPAGGEAAEQTDEAQAVKVGDAAQEQSGEALPQDLAARMAREFARRLERRLTREPGSMRFLELFEPGGLIEGEPRLPAPGDRPPGSGGPCAPS